MSARARTTTVILGMTWLAASCGTPESTPGTQPEPASPVVEATGPGAGDVRPLGAGEAHALTSRILAIRTDWGAGRHEAARTASRSLVLDYPERLDVHELALEVAGDDEAARLTELRRWLGYHPDSPVALHELAQSLIDPDLPSDMSDPAAAVDAAQSALTALGQPDATYLVTLGTAYYLNGNTEKAIQAYENALIAASRGQGSLDCESELREFIETLKHEP